MASFVAFKKSEDKKDAPFSKISTILSVDSIEELDQHCAKYADAVEYYNASRHKKAFMVPVIIYIPAVEANLFTLMFLQDGNRLFASSIVFGTARSIVGKLKHASNAYKKISVQPIVWYRISQFSDGVSTICTERVRVGN